MSGPVGAQGVVVDFADVARVVERDVIARMDHRYLNDIMENPTAELMAQHVWKTLEAAGLAVHRIRLWETEDSSVEVTAG